MYMGKYGLALAGICAGAVNGLFGAGGGMVLVPLLIVFLFWVTNLASIMPEMDMILTVLVITCSAPIASAVVQFAEIYRSEVEFASVTNIASVLFSIVTMPVMVACYQLLSKV